MTKEAVAVNVEVAIEVKPLGKSLIGNRPFPELGIVELKRILGTTIKHDDTNKIVTFACLLSAYTETAQFNILFIAPSGSGKSYVAIEVAAFFPEVDVKDFGHCSPTSFFHDVGIYDETKKATIVDLSRKILIFLDQPQTDLLARLRPLLSHDKKSISNKITDKDKSAGHRAKNIILKGFPAVVFCTANFSVDEQEATRCFILSPEVSQSKIEAALKEKLKKESDSKAYRKELEADSQRAALKERILAIKNENIDDVRIQNVARLEEGFHETVKLLRPGAPREMGRLMSLVKMFALLNLWCREREGKTVIANDRDIENGLTIWKEVALSQELNISPHMLMIYQKVMAPLLQAHDGKVRSHQVITQHKEIFQYALNERELWTSVIPSLAGACLIDTDKDPDDKRRSIIVRGAREI